MTGPAAAARLVPDRWAGVVADHVFAGHRVVLDVGFGIGRARLRILARDGVLLRACHAAYSDGIADLAQAAGLSRLAAVRLADLADIDHCARIALRVACTLRRGRTWASPSPCMVVAPAG
jgi:hypothetical protein